MLNYGKQAKKSQGRNKLSRKFIMVSYGFKL